MRKGVGPIAVGMFIMIALLLLEGIGLQLFISQGETYTRTIRETNIIQGINQVELIKRSLSQALEYSFHQASYLIGKRGGYSNLNGVDSLDCIPYWRVYGIESYPGLSGLGQTTLKIMNRYANGLNGEVYTPQYDRVGVKKETEDIVTINALATDKLVLGREKLSVKDNPTITKKVRTDFVKMLEDGRKTFIDKDSVKEAVQNGVNLFLLNHPECNEIEVGDICENKMETEANFETVLEKNCSDWETLLNDSIKVELSKLNLDGDSIKDIDVVFEGECSGDLGVESSSCDCKSGNTVNCNDNSESECTPPCKKCHDEYDEYTECCGKFQTCDSIGMCKPIGEDECFVCDEYYKKVKNVECTYDYYGFIRVLVGVTSGEKYSVFDGSTDFRNLQLQFYVLSGNNYEEISNLENPSFENGWTDVGACQKPNGWEVIPSGWVECVHKLSLQLPLEERLGGSNALILSGDKVYKIFRGDGSFIVELKQTITVVPGSIVMLRIPVQVHTHGGAGINEAKIKLSLNNEEKEIQASDHEWAVGSVKSEVPTGEAVITIHVESMSEGGIDFFIDDLKLYSILYEGVEPITNDCGDIVIPGVTTTTIPPKVTTTNPTEEEPEIGQYDRTSAVNYAEEYANKVVGDGCFFTDSSTLDCSYVSGATPPASGYDCAHFASYVLKEGGIDVECRYAPSTCIPYGEPGAGRLKTFIVDNGLGIVVGSVNQLENGDLIFYDWENDGGIDHVTVYIGNGKIASHTRNGIFEWNMGSSSAKFHFVHLIV